MKGAHKMILYPRNYNKTESGEDVGKALLNLIEENLGTNLWNFRLTFKKFVKTSHIKIIYDSEWCRMKFMFSRMRFPDTDELSIEYGRLHAPNEEPFMMWNGEECRCWHNVLVPIRFLDGLTPTDAFKQVMADKQLPSVVRNFRESEFGENLFNEYPPKAAIVMQSVLWKHYGRKLFELFDLRHPDLWDDYRKFLKEYYRLLDMKANYGPPYENVC
jgi:hypothetical protein